MNPEPQQRPPRFTPDQCALHEQALTDLQRDIKDIKLAVVGNDDFGVNGLVNDMKDLKEWRRKLDLRVASIAGGVSVVLYLAKFLLER